MLYGKPGIVATNLLIFLGAYKMQKFKERYSELPKVISDDMKPCMKRPIPVKATQMYGEFRVETLEGDYKIGKPGDYLMCGIDDEIYICDKEIFERSYDFLKD